MEQYLMVQSVNLLAGNRHKYGNFEKDSQKLCRKMVTPTNTIFPFLLTTFMKGNNYGYTAHKFLAKIKIQPVLPLEGTEFVTYKAIT